MAAARRRGSAARSEAVRELRQERRALRPRRSWWWRIGRVMGMLTTCVLVGLLAAVALVANIFLGVAKDLPSPEDLVNYSPGGITEIYATDKGASGRPIRLARVFSQNREFISITKVPALLQNATVAIEDERFYNHPGVDFQGVGRALYRNALAGNPLEGEGGSTLTQQLAGNVYLNRRQVTMKRKAQEMLLAVQIEHNFSKQQILELYLNEVYYGASAYGVQAAARTYFGKKVDKLTLAQAALIAGLPQRPGYFDPYKNKKAAVNRRNLVLAKMAELRYITPSQLLKAKKEPVKLAADKAPAPSDWKTWKAPYFVEHVIKQLEQRYGEDAVWRGGLKVYTTLNWKMQLAAEDALRRGVQGARRLDVTEGALVCVEPRTGYVRAMVGGIDYKRSQFNNAVQGKRQPGSSFKVFVYTAALDSRSDRFNSQYTSVDNSRRGYRSGRKFWRPVGGGPAGAVSMRTAVTYSYNNAAVNTAHELGIRNVIKYAQRMGIESEMPPYLPIALGAGAVSPLEMAGAYAVFPNHGDRAVPMGIRRVLDHEGQVLEEFAPQVERDVIGDEAVAQMSDMLQAVVTQGTASSAAGIHEISNAHGKTGTTNDNRDAWFVGYTPELCVAVWVTNAKFYRRGDKVTTRYRPMNPGAMGGKVCAPIWARFMKAAVPIQRKSGEPVAPPPEELLPPPRGTDVTRKNGRARRQARAEEGPYFDALTTSTLDEGEKAASAPPSGDDGERRPSQRAAAPPSPGTGEGTGASSPAPALSAPARPEPVAPPVASRPAPVLAAAPSSPNLRSMGLAAAPRAAAPPAVSRAPAPVVPRPVPQVMVAICPDSRRRATRWCPESSERSFAAGRAPRSRCFVHRAQPGDG